MFESQVRDSFGNKLLPGMPVIGCQQSMERQRSATGYKQSNSNRSTQQVQQEDDDNTCERRRRDPKAFDHYNTRPQ
jgi:hypothetical protein